jgi:hypothetical protein
MAEEGALLIGALLRRRGAGGGCHRNAPFVFIVDKIGSAHFPIHGRTRSHAATDQAVVALAINFDCKQCQRVIGRRCISRHG